MIQKCSTICIIGKPNAGKSTLLNKIIGQKIAIVSPKVQTTRSSITGIYTTEDTQLIFIDTPGIFNPRKKLEKAMVRCAWSSIQGVDHVILLIDAALGVTEDIRAILLKLESINIQPIIVYNKSDITKNLNIKAGEFAISSKTGKGIDKLLNYLQSITKASHWLYDKDDITNLPMRFLASEITREKLFLYMQDELPYHLTVETESWTNQTDGSAKIHQIIIVSKANYKAMIIGQQGQMIKKIGTSARLDIEKELGIKAHLFLFVKIREDWENNNENYNYMGLTLE